MPDVKRKEDYIDVSKYYDYERILSQKDSEGLVPSTYMIDTNRGDGKTTSFLIDALLRFYNNSYETVYLFREKQENGSLYVRRCVQHLSRTFRGVQARGNS